SYLLTLHIFLHCYAPHRDPHPFPTRRSSDLQSAEETGLLRRRRLARVRWRHAAERARAAPAGDDVAAQQDVSSASARRRSGNRRDRKSTRLNSSHLVISYAVFCLKKKKKLKI